MATQKPRVQGYVKQHLYDAFKAEQEAWGLRESEALERILVERYDKTPGAGESPIPYQGDRLTYLEKSLAEQEAINHDIIYRLERLEKLLTLSGKLLVSDSESLGELPSEWLLRDSEPSVSDSELPEGESLASDGELTSGSLSELPEGELTGESLSELPEGELPEGELTGESLSELPEGGLTGESLGELPEGELTGKSLSELPEDGSVSESLSELPEGKSLVSDSELPEGELTGESLSELPKGELTGKSLGELPEGEPLSESLSELPEDGSVSESLSELPEGGLTGESLSELPEGGSVSESLSELLEGESLVSDSELISESLSESLSELPEGEPLSESLSELPEGEPLSESLGELPEGEPLSESLGELISESIGELRNDNKRFVVCAYHPNNPKEPIYWHVRKKGFKPDLETATSYIHENKARREGIAIERGYMGDVLQNGWKVSYKSLGELRQMQAERAAAIALEQTSQKEAS